MQMYIGSNPNPDIDGSFDHGVITHEYGHGVSNRLVGGPAIVTCLENSEQMGEGWSDWLGLMFTVDVGDTGTTSRGIGTYLIGEPATGGGIRPAPYSTSFAVNGFTYGDAAGESVPHGVGFVWATALWEVTWDMIGAHGYSTDLYDAAGTAGNQIMLNLVIEGMKNAGCSPGFVNARDGVLAADLSLYPDAGNPGQGLHYATLWQAFARRGLGLSADQGTNAIGDETEAFDTPVGPPSVSVLPTSVATSVPATGDTTSAVVSLSNTAPVGSENLTYSILLTDATPLAEESGSSEPNAQTEPQVEIGEQVTAAPRESLPSQSAISSSVVRLIETAPASRVAVCADGQELIQGAATNATTVVSGGQELGQSFTAPCTGHIENVRPVINFNVAPNVLWGATMRLYAGEGTGGAVLGSTSFTFTNPASGSAYLTIPLPTPVPMIEGQVFTWFLDMTSASTGMQYSSANPLAGGVRYRTADGIPANAVPQAANDMQFRLDFLAPALFWVSTGQSSGSIAPGGSDNITLDFDATGHTPGTYTADMDIVSNAPTVTVPITFEVGISSVEIAGVAGWRFMAPAMTGMTVDDLASQNLVQGNPDYYPAAASNLYTEWTGTAWTPASGGSEALGVGEGFIWYFYDNDLDPGGPSVSVALPMDIVGTGSAATTDTPVTLHSAGDKWNLLANPFTSGLDISGMALAGWVTGGTLNSSVGQVWDSSTMSYLLTTDAPISDVVSPWQAMFVENNTATGMTYPAAARVPGGVFVRESPPSLVAFKLSGTDAENGLPTTDRALLLYVDVAATDEWDLLDATKLVPITEAYATLAFSGENEGEPVAKAQESRSPNAESFTVPMSFEAIGTETSFTLSWPRFENMPEDWSVVLNDLQTGVSVDLREARRYSFEAEPTSSARPEKPLFLPEIRSATIAEERFELVVTTGVVTSTQDGGLPTTFALTGAYPNPFNPATTVRFDVPQAGNVNLEVFDMLGRRVAQLVDGSVEAGHHTIQWNAANVASGVYVIRMSADDFEQAQSVTLLK